jgi:hypothetical protein
MRRESMVSQAEQARLMILIEQLQREGKSEQEIHAAVDEAVVERTALQRSS